MGINNTPSSERIHIGFFGCRNVGKSSIVNAVTNQEMSVVSDVKGTTTDAVKKSMELLPIGPVIIIDTPGFDDEGDLGEKRINATKKVLRSCDIAILVTVADKEYNSIEKELLSMFKDRGIPYIIVKNKIDKLSKGLTNEEKANRIILNEQVSNKLLSSKKQMDSEANVVYTSAINNIGIEELKKVIGHALKQEDTNKVHLVGDLIKPKDIVVLVTPIDGSAPKGRIILPQQMAIRDILDSDAIAIETKETELEDTLKSLVKEPELVITDSQVFETVKEIVPESIPLTSFSILMARYKGFLDTAVKRSEKIG